MQLSDESGTGPEYLYGANSEGHLIADEDRRIRLHFVDDRRSFDADDENPKPLPRVKATVSIILGDGSADRRVIQCVREMPILSDPFETDPNSIGPSWVDIADVDVATETVVALPGTTCFP